MDESIQRQRVGIYTIIVFLILVILIFLNSEGWNRSYSVYLKPDSAPGVKYGTPVRKNGILIGRVSDVGYVDDQLTLRLAIRESARIYANETVSIGAESILGDTGLEVLPLAKDQRGELLTEGSTLASYKVKKNPMELVDDFLELKNDFSNALRSVEQTGTTISDTAVSIDNLTTQVASIINDEDSDIRKLVKGLQRVSTKLESTFDNVDNIFESINETITDPKVRENFEELVSTLPKIFAEIQNGIASFSGVGEKVNGALDDIQPFTASLGQQGPEIVNNVNDAVKDVRQLVAKADGLSKTLETLQETFGNKNGTIGKLFNDSEAYDEALAAIKNLKGVSEEARRLIVKLEPILHDARVFTNKAATSGPSGILRNAIKRNPPDSGYKSPPGTGFIGF